MFILYGLIFTVTTGIIIKVWYYFQSGKFNSNQKLNGKTIIITGASAGIGKAAAFDLASRGAKLILACRNLTKANVVLDEIKQKTGNENVRVEKLDTSDLTSVREFAKNILKTENALDILINNAGVIQNEKHVTGDGLELTMATNHYGHFLLTNLLLGLMKSTGSGRVINVSSMAHAHTKNFTPEDLNFDKMPYSSYLAYNQSKLCNVLFTIELAEKLKNTGITVNSLHPGVVATEIFTKNPSKFLEFFDWLVRMMGKSSESGAQTTIYLAVSDEVKDVTGKYFVDCKETPTSELGKHRGFAKKLWEASELDVKLQPEEIHY